MMKEEIIAELEKRLGPLNEQARIVANATLDVVESRQGVGESGMVTRERAFQGENPPFEETAHMDIDERSRLMEALRQRNRAWLEQKCQEMGAGWLLVVDGAVVAHGAMLDDYPTDQEMEAICDRTGKFPLLFIQKTLLAIEETTLWPATIYSGDFYPTLTVTLAENTRLQRDYAPGGRNSDGAIEGQVCPADFYSHVVHSR
jgi:hypothetical protein